MRHNSRGFRGEPEHASEPIQARILAIGDSQTYGLGVDDDKTFCAQLAQMTGAEVINAGVNAYGVDQAVLMWDLEGKWLRPDVVVLGYYVDDFYRNMLAIRDWPKPHFVYDAGAGSYVLHDVPVPILADRAQSSGLEGGFRLRVIDALEYCAWRVRRKLRLLDEATLEHGAKLSEFLIDRLNKSVEQSGARLIVVFIGDMTAGSPDHKWIEESVTKQCKRLGIELLNFSKASQAGDHVANYNELAHLSERGHKLVAHMIFNAMKHR